VACLERGKGKVGSGVGRLRSWALFIGERRWGGVGPPMAVGIQLGNTEVGEIVGHRFYEGKWRGCTTYHLLRHAGGAQRRRGQLGRRHCVGCLEEGDVPRLGHTGQKALRAGPALGKLKEKEMGPREGWARMENGLQNCFANLIQGFEFKSKSFNFFQ
jgi:hypothetical protein